MLQRWVESAEPLEKYIRSTREHGGSVNAEALRRVVEEVVDWAGIRVIDRETAVAGLAHVQEYLKCDTVRGMLDGGQYLVISSDGCTVGSEESIVLSWHIPSAGQGAAAGGRFLRTFRAENRQTYLDLFLGSGRGNERITRLKRFLESETGKEWTVIYVADLKTLLMVVCDKAATQEDACLYCASVKADWRQLHHAQLMTTCYDKAYYAGKSIVHGVVDIVVYCPGHQVAQVVGQQVHSAEQYLENVYGEAARPYWKQFREAVEKAFPGWRQAAAWEPRYGRRGTSEDSTLAMKDAVNFLLGSKAWGAPGQPAEEVEPPGHPHVWALLPDLVPTSADIAEHISVDANLRCAAVDRYAGPDGVGMRGALRTVCTIVGDMCVQVLCHNPDQVLLAGWHQLADLVRHIWLTLPLPHARFLQPLHLLVDHTYDQLHHLGSTALLVNQWLERQHQPDEALGLAYGGRYAHYRDRRADYCAEALTREAALKLLVVQRHMAPDRLYI